jgi:hypothetical protein
VAFALKADGWILTHMNLRQECVAIGWALLDHSCSMGACGLNRTKNELANRLLPNALQVSHPWLAIRHYQSIAEPVS